MSEEEKKSRSAALRWDGLFWRRLAYVGSTRGPTWWRTATPPIVGAIIFALIGRNRRAVAANLRQVFGERGWLSEQRESLRTFIEFARVFQETLEVESRDRPGSDLEGNLQIEVQQPPDLDIDELFARDRGLVVLTSHFGCWEIGAQAMQKFQRPVNLVMATEANQSVEAFMTAAKKRNGLKIIRSNTSLFSSVEMIRALKRGEIVAMQLDRAAPGQVTERIDFFGKPAPFQVGPFMLARLAGVPLWPVYVVRLSRQTFRLLPESLRYIDRHAEHDEVVQVMRDVVASFERHVRHYPNQWFQFHRVWDGVS